MALECAIGDIYFGALGVLYQGLIGMATVTWIHVALCRWFFSPSWSYNIYMFLRDGHYPVIWLPAW